MRTIFATCLAILLATPASGQAPAPTKRVETAETPDGRRIVGRIFASPGGTFRFQGDKGEDLPLDRVSEIAIEGPAPDAAAGSPPFQVQLGTWGRVSGRLIGADGKSV